ncbi:MAG: hypothetical protein OEW08_01990 [Gammaproteobacteria bacterium]|nr:hypothetical protein [Gammaproteobacteria bacterium]
MMDLLNNPAFQGGVAPFLVALVCALLLSRLGWFWSGLAMMAGYFTTIALTIGFTLAPLTSMRKIIVIAFVATVIGVLRDALASRVQWLSWVVAAFGAFAVLWVIWVVVDRTPGMDGVLLGLGGVAYGAWMAYMYDHLREHREQVAVAASTGGLTTGLAALFGASALLGQMGIGLGMAALASLVSFAGLRRGHAGAVMAVPAGVMIGVIGFASVVYAKLPWYCLPMLALVPLFGRMHPPQSWPTWVQTLVWLAITSAPGLVAVYLTWSAAGPVPI